MMAGYPQEGEQLTQAYPGKLVLIVSAGSGPILALLKGGKIFETKLAKALGETYNNKIPDKGQVSDLERYELYTKDKGITEKGRNVLEEIELYQEEYYRKKMKKTMLTP